MAYKMWAYLEGIAAAHQVDPLLFILIYLASTGPFLLASARLFHHIRRKKPLAVLVFLWSLCYAAPYIYVLAAGRNLAWWTYLLLAAVVAGGLALAARGLKQRLVRGHR